MSSFICLISEQRHDFPEHSVYIRVQTGTLFPVLLDQVLWREDLFFLMRKAAKVNIVAESDNLFRRVFLRLLSNTPTYTAFWR